MSEIEIGLARQNEAPQIASLHIEYISTGFLSSLGAPLLELIYTTIIKSDIAFCVVARDGNGVIGFMSGTTNVSGFYKEFLKKNFFKATILVLSKSLNLRYMKKIVESLVHPAKNTRNLPKAESLSLVVRSDYQGTGVSTKIFIELLKEFKKRGVNKFKGIISEHRMAARKLHEKFGGVLDRTIEVHKGEVSTVYVHEF